MTERIISAVSGNAHVPVQAPCWDYANAQKVSFTATAAQSAVINSPLVRLIATQDCFYTVDDDPTAANAAGSVPLPQMQNWAETITPGQKISVISNGVDGVGDNGSGYARPLQAGDYFYGFAEQNADNAAGAAGDVKVRVRTQGAVQVPISGLAITNIGAAVYASDDNTFTLTATDNTYIGRLSRFVKSGVGVVTFNTLITAAA